MAYIDGKKSTRHFTDMVANLFFRTILFPNCFRQIVCFYLFLSHADDTRCKDNDNDDTLP